jgi:hypothetical protein
VETTEEKVTDDLPPTDMNGWVFRTYTLDMADALDAPIDSQELTGDTINDSKYIRNRAIEERFNAIIEETVNWDNTTEPVRKMVLAGEDAYEQVATHAPTAYSYAQEGLLFSIVDLPYINLDKPYWNQYVNDELTVVNKRYFAVGDANMTTFDLTDCLLFNKQLNENLGNENMYEIIRSGAFTYDKFHALGLTAVSDVNGDGEFTDADSYGYVGVAKNTVAAFWVSGGVKTIKKDADDKPYFAVGEEVFINTYERILQTVYDDNVWYKNKSDNNVDLVVDKKIFEENRSLFADSTFYYVSYLRDMETEFGIIPFPKFDESQPEYLNRLSWVVISTFPVTNTHLEYTSIIMEALMSTSKDTVIPAYYDVTLKTKISRDSESEEMLDIMFENAVFDLGDNVYCGLIRDGVFSGLFKNGDRNLVSKVESMNNRVTAEIDKNIAAFEKLQ